MPQDLITTSGSISAAIGEAGPSNLPEENSSHSAEVTRSSPSQRLVQHEHTVPTSCPHLENGIASTKIKIEYFFNFV